MADADPPIGSASEDSLDPMAADVRRRMLVHLGVLPAAPFTLDAAFVDRLGPIRLSPADLHLITAAATPVGHDGPADRTPATASDAAHPIAERFVTASPAPVARFDSAGEPGATVVIVTYGTGQVIIDTLQALASSVAETPIEVVVVDNPHPDHADRSLTQLVLFTAGVLVVRPPRNLGFGGGCELGALHAAGDVLVFLNPDVTVVPGWLERLVRALADDTVSIAAPVLLNPDGSIQEVGQSIDATGGTHPDRELPAEDGLVDVDYASAACWAMRADEHDRLGGFDPAYFPAYFEDVDLAVRARALGGRCVVDTGVRIVHHRGTGTPGAAAPAQAQRDLFTSTWPRFRG